MIPVHRVLDLMLAQQGDRYRFGAEVALDDPDPDAFDCSELIQWACAIAGVRPMMPDGSWIQARHCRNHGTLIGVGDALNTPGALLFRFAGDPFHGGRPRSAHVAVSLGDGERTIEARSTKYGTGIFHHADRRTWTHGARIPGVDHTATEPDPARPLPPLDLPSMGELELPVLSLTDPMIKGADVGRVQALLINLGADPDGLVLEVDGRVTPFPDRVYGPKTAAAVRDWQGRVGLEPDAIVGPRTWSALLVAR